MNSRLIAFILIFLLLSSLGIGPAAAGFNEGVAAYKKGEMAQALKEFLPLAESGNASAQLIAAQILINGGKGVAKDVPAAMGWIKRAAEANNTDAQLFLGGTLYQGAHGQPADKAAALSWFERAANNGNQRAMLIYVEMKIKGEGGPAEPEKAVPFLDLLVAQGNVKAHTMMGVMSFNGVAMEKDYARAKRYFDIALKHGDTTALLYTGYLKLNGYGVDKNVDEGVRLIYRSANSGNYQAMVSLALALANGMEGFEQDRVQAYKWITILLNRSPQTEGFYSTAAGLEPTLRIRLSNREIAQAQEEASRFIATPFTPAGN